MEKRSAPVFAVLMEGTRGIKKSETDLEKQNSFGLLAGADIVEKRSAPVFAVLMEGTRTDCIKANSGRH